MFVLDYSIQHANYIPVLVLKWHPATSLGVNLDRMIPGQPLTTPALNRPLSLCTVTQKLSLMQNNWEIWSLIQPRSHLWYSTIDLSMDLTYSELWIKPSRYLTCLQRSRRHLRIRQCLTVTDFHRTVL